jgi:hypothetical protein
MSTFFSFIYNQSVRFVVMNFFIGVDTGIVHMFVKVFLLFLIFL